MKAPQEILNVWKLEKEHGDIEKIHENYKINRRTITDALTTGRMDVKTFDSIKDFYSKKRKAVKKLIAETVR